MLKSALSNAHSLIYQFTRKLAVELMQDFPQEPTNWPYGIVVFGYDAAKPVFACVNGIGKPGAEVTLSMQCSIDINPGAMLVAWGPAVLTSVQIGNFIQGDSYMNINHGAPFYYLKDPIPKTERISAMLKIWG